MPNWSEILEEIRRTRVENPQDAVRRKYLSRLHDVTGRNVIIYYSGWLQKGPLYSQGVPGFEVNDADKNGFMTCIHNIDRDAGLDLVLHTPGGATAATESLVDYLRSMFGTNMRAIIPQLAMSAGTMIALSCEKIIMGRHSSVGPIDPQFAGRPAHAIIEEFDTAKREIAQDPSTAAVWQPIIAKYDPTLIGECQKAIEWSSEMVLDWLASGMFRDTDDPVASANKVVDELGDHAMTKSHSRHISLQGVEALGINVMALEDDDELQEAVLSIHHATIQSLTETGAVKIIENHNGVAFIQSINVRSQ